MDLETKAKLRFLNLEDPRVIPNLLRKWLISLCHGIYIGIDCGF